MRLGHLWPLAVSALVLSGCAGGWRNGPPPGADAAATASATASTAAGGATAADVGVYFIYRGDASSVSLAGEFNGWNTTADPMTKQADGSWQIVKKLEPGRYAYKFVIDGSTWKADDAAKESVDDGLGGKNSVVVVGSAGAAAAGSPPAATAPAKAPAPPAGGGTASMPDGAHFVYRGPGNSVNVAGEFNGWNTSADALAKQADGSWLLVKKLDPGRYPYKFVIDGGTWKADDAAAESVDDGFGGKNSIVVVGAGAGQGGVAAAVVAGTPVAPATTAPAPAVTGKAAPPQVTPDGVKFIYADAADQVSLAGDFNSWSTTADPMTRQADGTWTIVKQLAPGTYAYKFLVNGKTWKQDEANSESKDDGFGGKNSVVAVH